MVGCLQGRRGEDASLTVNKVLTMARAFERTATFFGFSRIGGYFGMGTDDPLSPLRSAIQTSLPKG